MVSPIQPPSGYLHNPYHSYPPNIWSSSGRTPQYPFSVQFGDTGYSSSASSNRPSSESSASPDNADPFTPNPHFSPNTMVPHYDTRLNSGPENTRPFHYGSGRAGMMAAPRQPYLDTLTSTGGGVLTPGDASLPMPWNSHHPIAQESQFSSHGHFTNSADLDRFSGVGPESIDLKQVTGMNEDQLINMPTRELNKTLKARGLSREQIKTIKVNRRTWKNRGYAASCRVKREEKIEQLKEELQQQNEFNNLVTREIESVCEESKKLKKNKAGLEAFVNDRKPNT